MKKFIVLVLSAIMLLSLCSTAYAGSTADLTKEIDKSTLPRVLITTDLEVDDINGVLLTLMYCDMFDLAGIVWTAGMYHFSGDGEHTLEEVTPNHKCEAGSAMGDVADLTEWRPVEPGILTRFADVLYREDYEYLSQNNPNYPTPDELLSICKEGNIAFEGDTRYDTEGSDFIKQCILDDDPRPLYITHWGGFNTTARALLSIYEEYSQTEEWDAICAKVVDKVRFMGSGEDNCREDSKVDELFPGLQDADVSSFFSYGSYFSPTIAADELLPYYQAEYLVDAFKKNHGQILGEFHLMNDGEIIYGEPYIYQYGLKDYLDWSELWEQGYSTAEWTSIMPRYEYDRYDWMCCQFTTNFIDIGLRADVSNSENHYVAVMFDELAARADWAVMSFEECNHAPVVSAEVTDFTAKAGDVVDLSGEAYDPDGNELTTRWYSPVSADTYAALAERQPAVYTEMEVSFGMPHWWEKVETIDDPDRVTELAVEANGFDASFTVPEDAVAGDVFVINLEVQDVAERPMTRFAQYVITVE